jgi:isoamylase
VPDPNEPPFDWEGDTPPRLPMEDLVVYEMHVRGFTAHPSSGVEHPGTYSGVVERLDYLQRLGVNALELMPVHEFNELEYYKVLPGSNEPARVNYWGYSTVGYFAPMSRFSAATASGASGLKAIDEFKTLVKECHRRSMEVILDVVFNHTAEGSEAGPTLSFRGIDNRVYYMLAPEGQCYNYSGCGNTVNCNQPVVRQFIVDCLRYWVEEMHVDGFRFDLGSIMTRAHSAWHAAGPCRSGDSDTDTEASTDGECIDAEEGSAAAPLSGGAILSDCGSMMTDGAGVPTGTPLSDPPLIAAISDDPVLSGVKLIAEAWDCDGLNQVGAFPHYGGRWSEWNGHFRDTARQFIKGTDGSWVGNFASTLCGSPQVYAAEQPGENDWWGMNGGRVWRGNRGPTASVNFVTAHDGFTLADAVSYNEKHNEANGEDNRDGESHNLSWNCGEEGPSNSPAVAALRARQSRNLLCSLLLSHGVPMLLMGDECGHTKGGNNNTYCHDSPLNWLDWDAVRADEGGLLRFVRHLITLRKARSELRRATYVTDADVQWHGLTPGEPDWTEASRFLALTMPIPGPPGSGGLYIAFNTGHLSQVVSLPEWDGRVWQPLVDTGRKAPYDFLAADERLSAREVAAARAALAMWTLEGSYPILPWSCVVLESVPADQLAEMPGPEEERREPAAAAVATVEGSDGLAAAKELSERLAKKAEEAEATTKRRRRIKAAPKADAVVHDEAYPAAVKENEAPRRRGAEKKRQA